LARPAARTHLVSGAEVGPNLALAYAVGQARSPAGRFPTFGANRSQLGVRAEHDQLAELDPVGPELST
jgi:hypothetical protein